MIILARRVALVGIVAAAVVGVYLAVSSGPKPYVMRLSLADADGLREGSPVAIAGQDVGKISMTVHDGRVMVTAKINHRDGPVGKNATAAIDSVNLLGQKRMEITKGNLADPAPSGYELPSSQVSVSADLDQVLDVLTPDVRARLGILIDESGAAVAGRQADISQTLEEFPNDFADLRATVAAVADNNHTLGSLVETTNSFVNQLASQNTALEHAIDTAGQTAATVAGRRAALAATLTDAPATLTELDAFLAKFKAATVPLGPAAEDISTTAPELDAALKQVEPFRQAADPALVKATQVAPELTSLATGATPVLTKATPVIGDLANFSQDLKAFGGSGGILDKSTDNLLAILQNWSRAIEFRDGLSHVFRGEATVTTQTIDTLINTLASNPVAGSSLAKLEASLSSGTRTSSAKSSAADGAVTKVGATLSGLVGSLTQGTSKSSAAAHAAGSKPATSAAPGATTASTTTASSTSTTSSSGNSLSSLLGYLLK
jgi:phospholipid/cholesterol/gamma-HCH transport system substrate-binding protein